MIRTVTHAADLAKFAAIYGCSTMKAFTPYSNSTTYRSWLAGHGFRIGGIGRWLAQFSLSGRVVIWENAAESLAIVAFSDDVDAVACTMVFSEYAQ